MSRIVAIHGREVLDSRGNPTVEVDVQLSSNVVGSAIVPSGASVGSFEAVERRDDDPNRYAGKGVLKAIENVDGVIAEGLHGLQAIDQQAVDARLIELDGTPNKQNLGANALLGVSLATLDAAARAQGIPLFHHVNALYNGVPLSLPVPMMNVLNGGAHADNAVVFQEFMIIPVAGETFRETLRIGVEIFQSLKKLLQSAQPPLSTTVGDEGGFAPNLASNNAAIEFLVRATNEAGYEMGRDCFLGLDCAATEFCDGENYRPDVDGFSISPDLMIELLTEIKSNHPYLISIEDGCHEDRFEDWRKLTASIGSTTQLVGDDVFVTNRSRFEHGIELNAGNAILLKLNQIGTVSEMLDVMQLAQQRGYKTVVSHRSGDTEDTKIADIAVGTGAGQIKTGSASRSERVAKYNRLLRIEDQQPGIAYNGIEEFSQFL